MRICPKCDYHDAPIWRNSRFYFNVDVARLTDLDGWDSSLMEKLKQSPEGYYEDGHFSYLLDSSKSVVLRKETALLNKDVDGDDATSKKEKWFQIAIEKRKKKQDSRKTKLTKFLKKTVVQKESGDVKK